MFHLFLVNSCHLIARKARSDPSIPLCSTLGTPSEETWPGVSQLPDYQPHFPIWESKSLVDLMPDIDPLAVDLLVKMLVYEPSQRISAKAALNHPYFQEIKDKNFFQ
jgi:serine/threonine protein kinase